jgi:hypothetical protein
MVILAEASPARTTDKAVVSCRLPGLQICYEHASKRDVLGVLYLISMYYWGLDLGRADEVGVGGVSAAFTNRQTRIAETNMNSAPARKRA